ncbi:MAG TPA: FliH/SctL family protein [Chlamydiales bacterium]|nr:FliH/SctL family protein [Chlamydiales bacterium]
MKYFSLIKDGSIHTAPGQKIIPEKEFSKLQTANAILKKVHQDVIEYKKEVAKEAEKTKQAAYEEGYIEGLAKLNAEMLKIEKILKEIEKSLEKKVLPIALKAAKKIVGEEIAINEKAIVSIIKQAIQPVIKHHQITLYVNKEELAILQQHKNEILALLDQAKHFSIQARSDIQPGGCIIETEAGIINAQLDNQLRALETAFERFKKK